MTIADVFGWKKLSYRDQLKCVSSRLHYAISFGTSRRVLTSEKLTRQLCFSRQSLSSVSHVAILATSSGFLEDLCDLLQGKNSVLTKVFPVVGFILG